MEAMAFQLLLHKVTSLERAMQGIPPLLKKIIDHLEAQTKQPEVEVATYAQLYPELPQDEAEETEAPVTAQQEPAPQHATPRRFWRWFMKEG
jgi:hypothetical protein